MFFENNHSHKHAIAATREGLRDLAPWRHRRRRDRAVRDPSTFYEVIMTDLVGDIAVRFLYFLDCSA